MSSATPSTTYDTMIYGSMPRYSGHPDCLGTLATVLGMSPASPARCRVLEIGCSDGGNLLPMAIQFPESRFVGIDLSPKQIELGQAFQAEAGVQNLDLRALSIADVDESLGQFDYIVCHGVYSWVPHPLEAKILEICRDRLTPQGVAMISLNVLPGWNWKRTIREFVMFHAKKYTDPDVQTQEARKLLRFYVDATEHYVTPYSQHIRSQVKSLIDEPDTYLFHEFLEENNHPIYFTEFAERLRAHGLQYLAESYGRVLLDRFPPHVRQTLTNLADDLVQMEQYVDFLVMRLFRYAVIAKADVALDRSPAAEVVYPLHAGALARPLSQTPELFTSKEEAFRTDVGHRASTDQPLGKTILKLLADAWPRAIPFEQLWTNVRTLLADHGCLTPMLADNGRNVTAQYLLQAYQAEFVSLHLEPFRPAPVTHAPRGSRLARLLVAKGAKSLPHLRHGLAKDIPDLERVMLSMLDGTNDRVRLAQRLVDAAAEGRFTVERDGRRVTDRETLRQAIDQLLEPTLANLARSCLLEA